MNVVYADNNSTTRVAPEVVEYVLSSLGREATNPDSAFRNPVYALAGVTLEHNHLL